MASHRCWGAFKGLKRYLLLFVVLVVLSIYWPVAGQAQVTSAPLPPSETLAPARRHPLPPTLAQWQSPPQEGDYFLAIRPVEVGYLIWSRFPVTVYLEPAIATNTDRSREWVTAVTQAIQEWGAYLPLEIVPSPEAADITIWRRSPTLRLGTDRTPRARSAETRYELYIDQKEAPPHLSHRFTILLRPSQSTPHIRAAARHELGHALGIWGHSPLETDALYFSQVRTPPPISIRDVNTLKRVYEQPTRLGWPLD